MTQDTKPILIKCGYKDAEVDKIINKTVTKKYPKSKEKKKMMTTRRSQMESKFMVALLSPKREYITLKFWRRVNLLTQTGMFCF